MTPQEIAPEVYRLAIGGFVNAYLIGNAQGWVLIDTGIEGHFETIRDAAEQQFGIDARPGAILLTHGHRDHVGSALALAAYWDVPIYAHRMEAPYLTGKSAYPPFDPTVGGLFGFVIRFFGSGSQRVDLGDYYRPLPDEGIVPVLGNAWRWVHIPGHAPGQVAFWREQDRTLLAGDAIMTLSMDSLRKMLGRQPVVDGPPAPITPDWYAARKSVERLAELKPAVLAAGHGEPLFGAMAATKLKERAESFRVPERGRYVAESAEFDEHGVRYLPPIPADPLPIAAGIALSAVIVGFGVWALARKRRG